VRTLSLFFCPALALTYFAGTQYPHHWSFVLAGGAIAFLYLLIAQFYKIALDAPTGITGCSVSQVSAGLLFNYMSQQEEIDLKLDTDVFVATNESGIVEAHDIFMARYQGRKVLVIGSDLKKRSDYNNGN
jgi:hypothetical protein